MMDLPPSTSALHTPSSSTVPLPNPAPSSSSSSSSTPHTSDKPSPNPSSNPSGTSPELPPSKRKATASPPPPSDDHPPASEPEPKRPRRASNAYKRSPNTFRGKRDRTPLPAHFQFNSAQHRPKYRRPRARSEPARPESPPPPPNRPPIPGFPPRVPTLYETLKRERAVRQAAAVADKDVKWIKPKLVPPISLKTLRELDISNIMKNPGLRHDIIHSPSLQFRSATTPAKALESRQYWAVVSHEVTTRGCRCLVFHPSPPHLPRTTPCRCATAPQPSRIPPLVRALRDILADVLPRGPGNKTPGEDARALAQVLDHEQIHHQMLHGTLNVGELMAFVGEVLKKHCAPVRDKMVEAFVDDARQGRWAVSLKGCFEVLEIMKIDVANHQLIAYRPALLASAAEFEYRHFEQLIRSGTVTLTHTQRWLQSSLSSLPASAPPSLYPAFIHGLSSLALSPPAADLPETLQMDKARLDTARADLEDVTVLALLLLLCRQAAGPRGPSVDLTQIKDEIWILLNDGARAMASTEDPNNLFAAPAARAVPSTASSSPSPSTSTDSSSSSASSETRLLPPNWRANLPSALLHIATRSRPPTTTVSPSPAKLAFLASWASTNMDPSSALHALLASRMRAILASLIEADLERSRFVQIPRFAGKKKDAGADGSLFVGTGLECLEGEIRTVVERLGRIAEFNLAVFQHVYAEIVAPPTAAA